MIDLILLKKAITLLVYPLGLFFLGLIAAFVLSKQGRPRWSSTCKWAAFLLLLLASNPVFSVWLAEKLERIHPQVPISSLQKHDAIVVLGGGLAIPQAPALTTQLVSGSDRYWHAAQIFKAGKADYLLIAGGNVFNRYDKQGNLLPGEAYYAAQLLMQWGVSRSAIRYDDLSRTTAQNRDNISSLLLDVNAKSVILVTSALHMPRAKLEFKKLDLQITPMSADVLIRETHKPIILSLLPSASALALTTKALHEYYGLVALWLSSTV